MRFMFYVLNHVQLFVAHAWTVIWHAPLSPEFPRQEYWSGLPFHTPGNLPNTHERDSIHISCIFYIS